MCVTRKVEANRYFSKKRPASSLFRPSSAPVSGRGQRAAVGRSARGAEEARPRCGWKAPVGVLERSRGATELPIRLQFRESPGTAVREVSGRAVRLLLPIPVRGRFQPAGKCRFRAGQPLLQPEQAGRCPSGHGRPGVLDDGQGLPGGRPRIQGRQAGHQGRAGASSTRTRRSTGSRRSGSRRG